MRKKRASVFLMDPGDYLNDPVVLGMTTLERGAYSTLLFALWSLPEPGVVEGSDLTLRVLSRTTPEEWEAVRPSVSKAFDLTSRPGRWVQKRMVRVYRAQNARFARLAAAGSRGGRAKRDNEKGSRATSHDSDSPKPSDGGALLVLGSRSSVNGKDKEKRECASQGSAPSVGEKPIFSLPTAGRIKVFEITAAMIARWRELYPSVDIEGEIRKMIGWSEANPRRKKTVGGVPRWINGWLAREQDKPKMQAPAPTPKKVWGGRDPALARMDRFREEAERRPSSDFQPVGDVLQEIMKGGK